MLLRRAGLRASRLAALATSPARRAIRAVRMRTAIRGQTFYICHVDYHHDHVYGENIREYLLGAGIPTKTILLERPGPAPQLRQCIGTDSLGVIGFNSQLDHSWVHGANFLDAAASRGVPVIQWMLDHPSSRLTEFENSTSKNSRFLFSSADAETYFNRYGIPGALSAFVGCVGQSRHSRADGLTLSSFAQRPILCLLAMNLRRIGGTLAENQARVTALGSPLSVLVSNAIDRAYPDLIRPVESHLEEALTEAGLSIPDATRHRCVQLIEEIVQIRRRQKIFSIAREFPVLIQSDEASRPFQAVATASFEEDVNMAVTWSRLKQARAQVSVSNMHDMVHDRILNGLNAGCANVVEDSIANRRAFAPGRNVLFFRYDDDSLRQCLEFVCNDVERTYGIAAAGFALRDDPMFRFSGFEKILGLARRPPPA